MGIRSRLLRRSPRREYARRSRKRQTNGPRLVSEALENRIVLDGSGGASFVVFAPFLDSDLGDDPHVEEIGPAATQLELRGGVFASIGSYIDTPEDVDAYQFQATGELLNVGGVFQGDVSFQLFNAQGTPVAPIEPVSADTPSEPDNNVSEPGVDEPAVDPAAEQQDPEVEVGDGFVGCDWGPFNFCDIFPTEPGETYFVTVDGGQVTEYYYDLFQDLIPKPSTGVDSELGDDPHADRLGREATLLDFSMEPTATIHSYIDGPGDVDVFGFRARGPWMQSFAWMGEDLGLRMQVFDVERNLIASNRETFVDPVGAAIVDPFVDVELEIGQLYFLRVSAYDDAVGEYGIDVFQDIIDLPPDQSDPDSAQGDDPHIDAIGPAATTLEFVNDLAAESGRRSRVDSYIDEAGDIDVFQFVAEGDSLGALSFSLDGSFHPTVSVFDVGGNEIGIGLAVGPAGPLPHGPVGAEITPGNTYYILVSAAGDRAGEYILEVRETMVAPPPAGAPDSALGDDPHADRIGANATVLAFDGRVPEDGPGEYYVHVDSYIDAAGDVDVFQFLARGNWLSAFVFSWDGSFEPQVTIYDGEGNAVPGDSDIDLNGDGWVAPFGDVPLVPGMAYYILIDAADGGMGEYVLDVYQYAEQTFEPLDPPRSMGTPDSAVGTDPHADAVGDEATVLKFETSDDGLASISTIDTYLDWPSDVDAFQWVADTSRSVVSAHSWNSQLEYSIAIYDSHQTLIAHSRVAGEGNSWGFANLSVATLAGETYYVAVNELGGGSGEYILNVRQTQSVAAGRGPTAASEMGDDLHVDAASSDATVLSPDAAGRALLKSFIDVPGDVDMFQFAGTGGVAFAMTMALDWGGTVDIRVLDSAFDVIEPGSAMDQDPFGIVGDRGLRMWNTRSGETYYLEISAREPFTGQYVLNLFTEPGSNNIDVPTDVPREINQMIALLPDGPHVNDRNGSHGDANLDGRVDGLDFGVWRNNKFTLATGPANGDFNNDGAVDGSDFNIWSTHRFQSATAAGAAPIPSQSRAPRPAFGASVDVPLEVASDATSQHPTADYSAAQPNVKRHACDSIRTKLVCDSLNSVTAAGTARRYSELVQRRSRVHEDRTLSVSKTNTTSEYHELVDGLFAKIDEII